LKKSVLMSLNILNVTRHPWLIKYGLFYEYANEPRLHLLTQLRDPGWQSHIDLIGYKFVCAFNTLKAGFSLSSEI